MCLDLFVLVLYKAATSMGEPTKQNNNAARLVYVVKLRVGLTYALASCGWECWFGAWVPSAVACLYCSSCQDEQFMVRWVHERCLLGALCGVNWSLAELGPTPSLKKKLKSRAYMVDNCFYTVRTSSQKYINPTHPATLIFFCELVLTV